MLLDAHADTWDQYYGERYFHGTPFRRALEEGLIAPERSTLAGMRGPLYAPVRPRRAARLGLRDPAPATSCARSTRRRTGGACASAPGTGRCTCRSTSTSIDPAFAPATGTPEVAGLLPHEALAFLRALAGLSFVGFDVVEVAPVYDGPGQQTALLAASIAYELLALRASRVIRHAGPAPRGLA